MDKYIELDHHDELKKTQSLFLKPTLKDSLLKEIIYFNGNSLGLQAKKISPLISDITNIWGMQKVDIDEIGYSKIQESRQNMENLASNLGSKLVGALEKEVAFMNSLTTNLHLLFCSFYNPTKERYKIIMEYGAFNSDQYMVETQIKFHGFDPKDTLILVYGDENGIIKTDDIINTIIENHETTSIVFFSGVQYSTGQLFDMEKITKTAHDYDIIAGFDLAHAIGNVPLKLHDWNVDFAAWCTYKYLNSGPGSIGGIYVNERHLPDKSNMNILGGWWGQNMKSRIKFEDKTEFSPLKSAHAWQPSNPSTILLICLIENLQIFNSIGDMDKLFKKGIKMTNLLEETLINKLGKDRIHVITPPYPWRGSQLSFKLNLDDYLVKLIHNKILKKGLICDLRKTNVLRVTPVPLYNTYIEIFNFVKIFDEVVSPVLKISNL